jgi:hypothetical protein
MESDVTKKLRPSFELLANKCQDDNKTTANC